MRTYRMWPAALVVVALLVALPWAPALAAGTVAQLIPTAQAIAPGETTTVTLAVQDVQDLYGYEVEIAYDPAVLEVVDADGAAAGVQVALGSWLAPDFVFQNSADNALGTVTCVVSQLSPRPAVSGSGTLLTITFRGVGAGTSAVGFADLTLAEAGGTEIATSRTETEIEVTGGAPPETPTPAPGSNTAITLQYTDLGDQTEVEVWLENVADFYAVDFTLAFDPSIVQATAVVEGAAFTDHPSQCVITESSIGQGTVHFAGHMVCIAPDGDLHLATLTFADASCGTSPLTWQALTLLDNADTPIPHTAPAGSLTTYPCPAEIKGRALLEGRADHGGIAIALTGDASDAVVSDAAGAYGFAEVPGGTYELLLSHDLYLAARWVGCVAPAGETLALPEVTLLGGDLNGDGTIDISDLVIGGAQFGSDSAAADLTADGQVDIFDIVLIGKNFGQTGPVVFECP